MAKRTACTLLLLMLVMTGCGEKTPSTAEEETISPTTEESTTTEIPSTLEDQINEFKTLTEKPTDDTWQSVIETFPDIVLQKTVESNDPASMYGIGKEEYFLDDATKTLFVRLTDLDAVIGVYQNTTLDAVIEELTQKNYTRQGETATAYQSSAYQDFTEAGFTQALTDNKIILLEWFDEGNASNAQDAYLEEFFEYSANNALVGFKAPFSGAEDLRNEYNIVKPATLVIVSGDTILGKYMGTYTTEDLKRESVKYINTSIIQN